MESERTSFRIIFCPGSMALKKKLRELLKVAGE